MDINSIWKDTSASRTSFQALNGKISADVVVIGAGITGLTAAYLLENTGKKVVLLEARQVGDGTTGLSSCHLNTDLDFEYRNIISTFDETTARLIADSRVEGIKLIENIINSHSIQCEFKRVNGYLYSEDSIDEQSIIEEHHAASKSGLNVELLENAPLPFKTGKTVLFREQAEFNAQKYVDALAEIISKKNCSIYENSRVTNIEEKDEKCYVTTEGGSVEADFVFVATHYPLLVNPLQTMSAPYRSYMIAAKLNDNQYPEGLFWDYDDPYHYTKTYSVNNEKWIVVGGSDHKTGSDTETQHYYEDLENYVRKRYNVKYISHRWSSQYYEPVDGLPYIGRSPFSKKTFVATGFSGDGLVYGTIAAMIIADFIKGKKNKWFSIYDSTRFNPVASAKDFIKENFEVASHFIKDRFTISDQDFDDIKPGEGKIISKDGEKLAVSRDINNELNVLSPVCTHMGCFVQWNNSEKSWDCPCHGSRFSTKGKVLEGPAVVNLVNKIATSTK